MPGIRFPSGDSVTITLAYFQAVLTYRSQSGLFSHNSISIYNTLKRFRVGDEIYTY